MIALDPPPLFSHVCATFPPRAPCVSRDFSLPQGFRESRPWPMAALPGLWASSLDRRRPMLDARASGVPVGPMPPSSPSAPCTVRSALRVSTVAAGGPLSHTTTIL